MCRYVYINLNLYWDDDIFLEHLWELFNIYVFNLGSHVERCDINEVWNGAIKTNGSLDSLQGIDIIDKTRYQNIVYLPLWVDLIQIMAIMRYYQFIT